jgi:hypothetical protein
VAQEIFKKGQISSKFGFIGRCVGMNPVLARVAEQCPLEAMDYCWIRLNRNFSHGL